MFSLLQIDPSRKHLEIRTHLWETPVCVEQGAGYSSIVSQFHSHLLPFSVEGMEACKPHFPDPQPLASQWALPKADTGGRLEGEWKEEAHLKKKFFFAEVFGSGRSNSSGWCGFVLRVVEFQQWRQGAPRPRLWKQQDQWWASMNGNSASRLLERCSKNNSSGAVTIRAASATKQWGILEKAFFPLNTFFFFFFESALGWC